MNNRIFIPEFSRREREVLQLIFQGFSSKEIADNLFISLQTVESHRKNMISKACAKNMHGVIRIALERGMLEFPLPVFCEMQQSL